MVAQSPPFAQQNAQHSAALFRQAASSPFQSAGILAAGELAVAAQSTPNMSIQVAAGRAWMRGTQVANVAGGAFSPQASYFGLNDAPVTLSVASADPTNPRIDLVVAYVLDAFYSGASNLFVLGVITGTPAATPAAPAAPSNALTLATLAVAANATQITSGNIATSSTASLLAIARGGIAPVLVGDVVPGTYDGQYRHSPTFGLQGWNAAAAAWQQQGGHVTCTSTTRPASPPDGLAIYETDTKAFGYFETASNTWIIYDTRWQTYTPNLATTNATNYWTQGSGGTAIGRYWRTGRLVTVEGLLKIGTGTTFGGGGAGTVFATYPPGYAPSYWTTPDTTFAPAVGTCEVYGGSFGLGFVGIFGINGATPRFEFLNATAGAVTGTGTGWNISASGHGIQWTCTYETNFGA